NRPCASASIPSGTLGPPMVVDLSSPSTSWDKSAFGRLKYLSRSTTSGKKASGIALAASSFRRRNTTRSTRSPPSQPDSPKRSSGAIRRPFGTRPSRHQPPSSTLNQVEAHLELHVVDDAENGHRRRWGHSKVLELEICGCLAGHVVATHLGGDAPGRRFRHAVDRQVADHLEGLLTSGRKGSRKAGEGSRDEGRVG